MAFTFEQLSALKNDQLESVLKAGTPPTVDYLAFVDPANTNLILGKSYSQFLGLRMFLGYFLLERLRQSGYEGPAR